MVCGKSGKNQIPTQKVVKRHKYNVTDKSLRTANGIVFDSRREMMRYLELLTMERAGLIRNLELQPSFELQPKYHRAGKTERAIIYRADFQYVDCATSETIVEDVKGYKTKEYLLKRKMLFFRYPNINFREV